MSLFCLRFTAGRVAFPTIMLTKRIFPLKKRIYFCQYLLLPEIFFVHRHLEAMNQLDFFVEDSMVRGNFFFQRSQSQSLHRQIVTSGFFMRKFKFLGTKKNGHYNVFFLQTKNSKILWFINDPFSTKAQSCPNIYVSMPFFSDSFVNSQEWTLSRGVPDIRLGIVGSLSSGKSALVHRYLTGSYMQEESPEGGRFKKEVVVDSQSYLLLIRDEGGPPELQVNNWLPNEWKGFFHYTPFFSRVIEVLFSFWKIMTLKWKTVLCLLGVNCWVVGPNKCNLQCYIKFRITFFDFLV